MNRHGFTLIELLVVIAIIGVLAGVVMVAINPATRMQESRDAGVKSDIGQIATAMEAYFTRRAEYPSSVADLVVSDDLKREPTHPDGTSYTVNASATNDAIIVYGNLEADASEGCAAGEAHFCFQSSDGQTGVVCGEPTGTSCGTFQ